MVGVVNSKFEIKAAFSNIFSDLKTLIMRVVFSIKSFFMGLFSMKKASEPVVDVCGQFDQILADGHGLSECEEKECCNARLYDSDNHEQFCPRVEFEAYVVEQLVALDKVDRLVFFGSGWLKDTAITLYKLLRKKTPPKLVIDLVDPCYKPLDDSDEASSKISATTDHFQKVIAWLTAKFSTRFVIHMYGGVKELRSSQSVEEISAVIAADIVLDRGDYLDHRPLLYDEMASILPTGTPVFELAKQSYYHNTLELPDFRRLDKNVDGSYDEKFSVDYMTRYDDNNYNPPICIRR